jgi:hypothetical protein
MPYFPPDARYLTEYRNSCEITRELFKKANVKDSRGLALWIQKNGLNIQEMNFSRVVQDLKTFNE